MSSVQVDYDKLTPEEREDGVDFQLSGKVEPDTEYTFTYTPGSEWSILTEQGEPGEPGEPVEYVIESDNEGYLPTLEIIAVNPTEQEEWVGTYIEIYPAPQEIVVNATQTITTVTPLADTLPWTTEDTEFTSNTDHAIVDDEEATFTFTPPEGMRLKVSGAGGTEYTEPGETLTYTAKGKRGEINFYLVASEDGVTELSSFHININSGGK